MIPSPPKHLHNSKYEINYFKASITCWTGLANIYWPINSPDSIPNTLYELTDWILTKILWGITISPIVQNEETEAYGGKVTWASWPRHNVAELGFEPRDSSSSFYKCDQQGPPGYCHWEFSSKWRFLGSYCILPEPESQGMESTDISSSFPGDSYIHQNLRITAKRCLHKENEFIFNVQNEEEFYGFLFVFENQPSQTTHLHLHQTKVTFLWFTTNSWVEGRYHCRVWGSIAARTGMWRMNMGFLKDQIHQVGRDAIRPTNNNTGKSCSIYRGHYEMS